MKYLRLLLLWLYCLAYMALGAPTPLTNATPVTSNGEWSFPDLRPGTRLIFSVSGTFGGGTVTLGYVNASGTFTAFGSASPYVLTAAGSANVYLPGSNVEGKGYPALSLTGATSPSLTVLLTKTSTSPDIDDLTINAATQAELDAKAGEDLAIADNINNQPQSALKYSVWGGGVSGQADPLRFVTFGDSYSIGFTMGPKMARSGVIGLNSYNSSGTVTSYSIANQNSRFDYWINGAATDMATGSTAQWTVGGSATGEIRGDRACVAYIKRSGGGTFDLQYSSNGGGNASGASDTGWNTLGTIDCSNATTIGAYSEFSLPTSNSPSYRLRIKNVTTSTATIITTGIYQSNGGGVIEIQGYSVGGWDMVNSASTSSAIISPILKGLRADLMLVCFAGEGIEWDTGGNFRRIYDLMTSAETLSLTSGATTNGSTSITYASNSDVRQGMRISGTGIGSGTSIASVQSATAATLSGSASATGSSLTFAITHRPDVVIVSGSPAADQSGHAAAIVSQLAWVKETRNTFINGAAMFGTYAEANANGMMGDTVHLSTAGKRYRNLHVWNKLPIGNLDLGAALEQYPAAGGSSAMFTTGVSTGMDQSPLMLNRPFMSYGTAADVSSGDVNSPVTFGNRVGFRGRDGEQVFFNQFGEYMVGSTSSLTGLHPSGGNRMLGSRGNYRWRIGATGIQAGYVAKTANYTLTADDFTVNCTTGSFTITLPAATATSSSTSAAQNVAAGLEGRIFVIANTGAGTITVATTSSQLIDGASPGTIAAGARLKVQSTGTGWITIP